MNTGRALNSLQATEKVALKQAAARIKLAFFDVDGTLVNSQRQVPASAARAIRALQAKGVVTAIASGRPPFAARAMIDALGLDGSGLFYTGAMLYDPAGHKVLAAHALPREVIQSLVERARAVNLHCELYTQSNYYSETKTEFTDYHTSYLGSAAQLSSFDTVLASQPIYKVLLVAGSGYGQQQISRISDDFPELVFATGHGPDRPDIAFVSVVSGSACKRAAFAQLCSAHRVEPDQVLSMGDADSDTEFLRLSGIGIAMGNASDAVKAAANYTTGHVDDDGLAHALQQLF